MITVKQAAEIIQACKLTLPTETLSLSKSLGRVLREPILADRDFPAYDRVSMDGIAIRFSDWEKGGEAFTVAGTQLAGGPPQYLNEADSCMEVMTGAMCPEGADTVIRYEDVDFFEENGKKKANITLDTLQFRQNLHLQASDRKAGAELIPAGRKIGSAEIAVCATVGKDQIKVSSLPRIALISTGDELVEIDQQPLAYQIRSSNTYALQAALHQSGISATRIHLQDDADHIRRQLDRLFGENDVLILSGGVSKGKADYVPEALTSLGVEKRFHRVKQRPGKPFWFGEISGPERKVVFALPGNPVSTYVNYYRYVHPWISAQSGQSAALPLYAILAEDFSFQPDLTYFLQVNVSSNENGSLLAYPIVGGGSGDHANLLHCNAFMELPAEKNLFKAGEVFPIIHYREL